MKNWLIALLLILLAAAAYYYIKVYEPFAVEPPPPPTIVAVAVPEPEQVLIEPVNEDMELETAPEIEDEIIVLPSLEESDVVVLDALAGLAGEAPVLSLLVSDNVVSRFVASVDALTSSQVPGAIMAVKDPGGEFLASANEYPENIIRNAEGDPIPQYFLNPANYKRYTPQVEMLEAFDAAELAALYRHYAPLNQQAYSELGYPDADFDARLVEVIDSLLATPEVSEPLLLIKPEAFFLFADPDLEALPAGQKALLRIGPMNALRVKDKLREIRAALVQ